MKKLFAFALALAVASNCVICSNAQELKGKKVLYINSYHKGYPWSDGIEQSLTPFLSGAGVEVKTIELDTYRQKTPEHLAKASEECKATIEQWQPGVVIISDDPGMKGVYLPFFKQKDVAFVFCGVNWDASAYGVPAKNITGMLEVCPVKELLAEMNKLKPGKTLGYLAADAMTPKIDFDNCQKILGTKIEGVFANDFEAWKKGFLDLQSKVDILLIGVNQGITGWDEAAARKFVEENTKIATGSWHDFLNGLSLVAFNKLASEQGEFAGNAATQILKGKSPGSIPVVANQKGEVVINARIAKKLGVTPSFETLQSAKVLE